MHAYERVTFFQEGKLKWVARGGGGEVMGGNVWKVLRNCNLNSKLTMIVQTQIFGFEINFA